MSSIGADFASWTASSGLTIDNGAVFWMSPDDGPQFAALPNGEVVVAQVTLAGSTPQVAQVNAQGRTHNQYDWTEYGLRFPMSPSRGGTPGGGH